MPNDPENYRALSAPRKPDEVNASIKAFLDEVAKLRKVHRLADVAVVIQTPVDYETGEGLGFTSSHMGALQEGEAMLARALGAAAAERREFINQAVASGRRRNRPAP